MRIMRLGRSRNILPVGIIVRGHNTRICDRRGCPHILDGTSWHLLVHWLSILILDIIVLIYDPNGCMYYLLTEVYIGRHNYNDSGENSK